MVNALFPRILQGQAGARAAQGIVAHGTVVATRVGGGVSSGREAVLQAVWGNVVLSGSVDFPNPQAPAPAFGVPIAFESQLGYTLRSVTVIDGGDYDTAPALRVVNAGQTYVAARLTANVVGGTIASVTVNAGGEYTVASGRVIAERPPRTHYADVDVLGNGGRRYTLRDCAAVIPVRVGDPVVVDAPNGDPRFGCFITGRQVPARPLIHRSGPLPAPMRESATRWRIGARVPHRYLGWPQAFAFDVSATASFEWPAHANWDVIHPTPAAFDLQVKLQVMSGGAWTDLADLGELTAYAELGSGRSARWRWSGIYQLDDGAGAIKTALENGAPASIVMFVDAGAHQVKWFDGTVWEWESEPRKPGYQHLTRPTGQAVWKRDAPTRITVAADYVLQVVELGSGTY